MAAENKELNPFFKKQRAKPFWSESNIEKAIGNYKASYKLEEYSNHVKPKQKLTYNIANMPRRTEQDRLVLKHPGLQSNIIMKKPQDPFYSSNIYTF